MRLHRQQERELLGAGRDGELRPGPVQVRLEPVPLRAHPGVSSAGGAWAGTALGHPLPSPGDGGAALPGAVLAPREGQGPVKG